MKKSYLSVFLFLISCASIAPVPGISKYLKTTGGGMATMFDKQQAQLSLAVKPTVFVTSTLYYKATFKNPSDQATPAEITGTIEPGKEAIIMDKVIPIQWLPEKYTLYHANVLLFADKEMKEQVGSHEQVISFPGFPHQKEKLAAPTKYHALSFDNQTYHLAFVDEKKTGSLNEYIPEGQTLENWKNLLSLRVQNGQKNASPIELAQRIGEANKKSYPQFNFEIVKNKNNEVVLQFITLVPNTPITELNIFKIKKESDDVFIYQYASRNYGKSNDKFLSAIQDDKKRLIQLVSDVKFPSLIHKKDF